MAEEFAFFDPVEIAPDIWDRDYNARQFIAYFFALVTTGLMKSEGEQLKVTVNGANMIVAIDTGVAFVEGHYYRNTASLPHTLDTESLGRNRIDRIVVRLDMAERKVTSAVKKGAPSTSPVAPALTQTENLYEISLAQVKVIGGQTYIGAADIVDERGKDVICPYAGSNILPNFDSAGLAELVDKVNGFYPLTAPTTGAAIQLSTNIDLNNLIDSGFYRVPLSVSPISGLPAGTYAVIVIRNSVGGNRNTDPVTQIFIAENVNGGMMYSRARSAAGVWSDIPDYVTSKLPARINAVLSSGWSNGAELLTYYKDSFGIVHLRGVVFKTTAASNTITTLPAGYRPKIMTSLISGLNLTNDVKMTSLEVSANGVVTLAATNLEGSAPINISFRTD